MSCPWKVGFTKENVLVVSIMVALVSQSKEEHSWIFSMRKPGEFPEDKFNKIQNHCKMEFCFLMLDHIQTPGIH
jgi:hypothetical protein